MLYAQHVSHLFAQQGKAANKLKATMSEADSDMALALMDPYNLDFLMLSPRLKERDLEDQLVS